MNGRRPSRSGEASPCGIAASSSALRSGEVSGADRSGEPGDVQQQVIGVGKSTERDLIDRQVGPAVEVELGCNDTRATVGRKCGREGIAGCRVQIDRTTDAFDGRKCYGDGRIGLAF